MNKTLAEVINEWCGSKDKDKPEEEFSEFNNVELQQGFNPLQPYEIYIEGGKVKHRNVDIR